jgi:hypothetical protein
MRTPLNCAPHLYTPTPKVRIFYPTLIYKSRGAFDMQPARGTSPLLSYYHHWNLLLRRTDDVRCRPLNNTACESHSWCKYANLVATIAIVAVFSVNYAVRLKKQFSIEHIETKEPDGSSPIDETSARAYICSSLLLDMASFMLRTRGRNDQIKNCVRHTYS